MTTATTSRIGSARVLADLLPGARVRDASLVVGGAALLTAAGYIAVPLPFTPVPISMATLAVLLLGASLGPGRAAASAGLYLVLGMAGMPLFAGGASGWSFPSFGYIVGYALAAVIVGGLARRKADRHVVSTLGTAALGTGVVYACGVPWLAFSLGVGPMEAIALGVVPFLIGDALKIALTTGLLPSIWKLTARDSE